MLVNTLSFFFPHSGQPFNWNRLKKTADELQRLQNQKAHLSFLSRLKLLDPSAKLIWKSGAEVSELPLNNLLGSLIMAGFN